MLLSFFKYSATGNDFIIIDNRNGSLQSSQSDLWERICTPKTGIGADGVLLLEESELADFKMRYINSDGHEAAMCGNGARAITSFAFHVVKLKNEGVFRFETMNGIYQSSVGLADLITIKMTELKDIGTIDLSHLVDSERSLYLNTGVPHAVFVINNLDNLDLLQIGSKIAHDRIFFEGANVNFIEVIDYGRIKLRTFEIGVEAETLSCGTGAVASAIATNYFYNWQDKVDVVTKGGILVVEFDREFGNIFLTGKVEKIFYGQLET